MLKFSAFTLPAFVGSLLLAGLNPAMAAEKTVTLDVDNMTCMSCPYQVKKALKKVDGVADATASMSTQQAVVTFEDSLTNVAALTEATTNAGYPSRLAEAQ